jgi:hypothetical protein
MSDAARAAAVARFRPDVMAASYGRLIDAVVANPPAIAHPLGREDWRLPAGLRSGLRTLLPNPLKNRLRQLRERWAT